MMKNKIAIIMLCASSITTSAQNISGSWMGELSVGNQTLSIVFNIDKDGCTMDSPDQGANGIATNIKYISTDSLNVNIPSIGATYSGKLNNDVIIGRFVQMGYSFTLNLKAGKIVRIRPQMPHGPYPYNTEEVTFNNTTDGASLSGTITYPIGFNKIKRVPVVLMVTGSGLQNRDEEIFDHKPFLVIADYLARHGIATLRYDDRGFGKSKGDVTNATTENFMLDANAGIYYLKATKKFGRVGVLGHSEGGAIAFILGSRGKVDFIVSMAGPGIKGDTLITEQNNALMRLRGMTDDMNVKKFREMLKNQKTNAWYNYFLDYDPAADISAIHCPVMAINGSMDMQVNATSNLGTISRLLPKSKANMIKEYAGLNHLFQHCTTGAIDEYGKIEETISPEVLADIASWIVNVK